MTTDSMRSLARDLVDPSAVLLVDDQPARLLTYEAILGDLGYALVKASSGVEALQRLMEREFAAILLDVNMPGMNGFETAAMIRGHPRFERTPLIFVTGVHVTDMDRLTGYQIGAVDYVYVPVVPEILRGKVQVLVELHERRREMQRLNAHLARTNAELEHANRLLHDENTRELQRLNRTLEAANAELESANRALEDEIAQRSRAQAQLQDADRRKDEFLAMLAHELRNPLSAIHNAVQIIAAHPSATSDLGWAQQVLGRQLQHLTRLIDDLLDVSRITTGKIKLRHEHVDLRVTLQRAIETVRPMIEAHRHRLDVYAPDIPALVEGDPVRLTQVIDNLLTNAIKYTDAGGAIDVVVKVDDHKVHLIVKDSGIGIAPAVLPHVFDLFTQAAPSKERSHGGLGIGLALAKALVELHGGSIEASSAGHDRGSTFTVHLPRVNTSTSDAPTPGSAASRRRGDANAMRLLLIDDNIDSADGMAMWLRLRGHDVRTAANGLDGLEELERFQPHAVLLDIGLPGIDGYEVARRVRAQAHHAQLPLIALTGYGRDSDRARAAQAGFTHHLVKPIDFETLEKTLALHASVSND